MSKKQSLKQSPNNLKKTLSRLMAAQIFYQYQFHNQTKNLNQIKEELIDNYLIDSESEIQSYRDEIDADFLDSLVLGLSLQTNRIDADISEFLKGDWTLEQLENVSLQILRLATFELIFLAETPAKVLIGEYVDIAASFFDNKKITFVNATLEALARKFRAAEFEIKI
jgi:N utilization substance protein B